MRLGCFVFFCLGSLPYVRQHQVDGRLNVFLVCLVWVVALKYNMCGTCMGRCRRGVGRLLHFSQG